MVGCCEVYAKPREQLANNYLVQDELIFLKLTRRTNAYPKKAPENRIVLIKRE